MIEVFAAAMFGGFARCDQRARGELYLRGLMLDGKRKSMRPMPTRLGSIISSAAVREHPDVGSRRGAWSSSRGVDQNLVRAARRRLHRRRHHLPARDLAAQWSIEQLQDLLDEWLIVGWQHRTHDALRDRTPRTSR